MAQDSEQQPQDQKRPSSPPLTETQEPAPPPPVSSQPTKKQQTHSVTKRIPCTRLNQANRFDRNSTQRNSKTLLMRPEVAATKELGGVIAGIIQPSKHFTNKCRVELQSLLEAIKPNYHEEIKSLYNEEYFADVLIKVGGQELKKPLHKCIIASRAFKFYSALKGFKRLDPSFERDIIVGNFQAAQKQDPAKISGKKVSREEIEEQNQLSETAWVKRKEELLREALEIFECDLPEDLISKELLLNFVRRAYLDQDLSEEESQLYSLICNWLKANKPELIKTKETNKHAPNHRESFRTLQPDFEQLLLADRSSPAMPATEQPTTDPMKTESSDGNMDESRDASQTNSMADENQGVASLTRTETFEMVSRTNPDSPLVDLSESNRDEADLTLDEDDKDRSEFSVNTSESSEPYTPVTRTGLKPKKFTTPVGMKSSKSGKTLISVKKIEPSDSNLMDTSGTAAVSKIIGTVTRSGSMNKSPATGASPATPPVASKRSSLVGSDAITTTPVTPKTRTTPSSKATSLTSKPKQTIIARAHPISIERSQSPGTSISKGSTKNFIAANKKLISQMERKVAPTSVTGDQHNQNAQADEDSECEVLDASLLALTEPLTTENLAAKVDKFALVSLSKLADALSKMLIGEILTDSIVTTRDLTKQIFVHRCILAARSAYLQDQINKQCLPSLTAESTSSTSRQVIKIDLSEYSYPVVYFAIVHIYSGIVRVPDDLDMEELAKLSHLLHVGTLRQVCTHHLRMNYCHYFHKPCNVCSIGVLKTLPIAWRYDLTELYSKCLTWIGSNFAHIFCLEEFSNLKPHDLIEECYKETLSQLTPDNVIQKTIECQKLLKSLPRVKWSESIICLVGRQLEDFCHYVADNYEKILQSESFLNLGKSCWECEVLEENLLAAMNHLKPDAGCKTLMQLDKIECSIETYCEEPKNVSDTFANLISKMRKYCERYLLKEATSVVHCSSWRHMTPSLQKRIKDQALLSTDFDEPTKHLAAKPKLPSMARHQQQSTVRSSPSPQPYNSGSDTRSPSNRSTPDSKIRSPNTTYLPPPKTKPAVSRHVKVLK